MTLHFLGNVTPDQYEALLPRLAEVCVAPAHEQKLNRYVVFPSERHGRVAGIGGVPPAPFLARLHAALAGPISSVGIRTENRELFPHLTLVRFREPLTVADAELYPGELAENPILFPVSAVTLFRSRMSKEGSTYEILREFPLAPAP